MKSFKLFIALFLGSLFLYTGCEPNYDVPPMTIPEASWKANTSILDLKTTFDGDLDSIGIKPDGNHYIIEGTVIGNDISGNIFKTIIVQDATAAITIAIDGNNLYNAYRVGQKLVIDCSGLYLGKYFNVQQLAYPSSKGTTAMPLPAFEAHVQLSGLPIAPIDTMLMTIPQLKSLSGINLIKAQSQLIELKSVYFVEGGNLSFSDPDRSSDRVLKDTLGNSIIVRNSNYSDFATQTLPEGLGDIVAILSAYNTTLQLILRTRDDAFNFNGTPVPEPPVQENSKENPYSIEEAKMHLGETNVWVQGYIVGVVNGQSLESNAEFVPPFNTQSNILLAEISTETNPSNTIPVQLLSNTTPRYELNLKDNPSNLGKLLLLKCNLESYYNTTGIKNISEFEFK